MSSDSKMRSILAIGIVFFTVACAAQDTFYVKRKTPSSSDLQTRVANADTISHDSIITYTCEYRKPGSNIWTVNHMKGPYLEVPDEVFGTGTRVLFTEIIAIDRNGRRYRKPDRYYSGGVYVDAPK